MTRYQTFFSSRCSTSEVFESNPIDLTGNFALSGKLQYHVPSILMSH